MIHRCWSQTQEAHVYIPIAQHGFLHDCFDSLNAAFCHAIRLGVSGRAGNTLKVPGFSKFFELLGAKIWAIIAYEPFRDSLLSKYLLETTCWRIPWDCGWRGTLSNNPPQVDSWFHSDWRGRWLRFATVVPESHAAWGFQRVGISGALVIQHIVVLWHQCHCWFHSRKHKVLLLIYTCHFLGVALHALLEVSEFCCLWAESHFQWRAHSDKISMVEGLCVVSCESLANHLGSTSSAHAK